MSPQTISLRAPVIVQPGLEWRDLSLSSAIMTKPNKLSFRNPAKAEFLPAWRNAKNPIAVLI